VPDYVVGRSPPEADNKKNDPRSDFILPVYPWEQRHKRISRNSEEIMDWLLLLRIELLSSFATAATVVVS